MSINIEILAKFTKQLHTIHSEQEVLRLLVSSAMKLVGARYGSIGLWANDTMVFHEYCERDTWAPVDCSVQVELGSLGEYKKAYFSHDSRYKSDIELHRCMPFTPYNLLHIPLFDQEQHMLGCLKLYNSVEQKAAHEETMSMLEIASNSAVLALENLQSLKQLQNKNPLEHIQNRLLELSMRDMAMSELLEKSLDIILDITWLSETRTGGIVLTHETEAKAESIYVEQGLVVKALSPACACSVCKTAIEKKEILLSECDDTPDDAYPYSTVRGAHYVVPLLKDSEVLGLLMIYADKKHALTGDEVFFLEALAKSLVNLILHKQRDDLICEREQQYRTLVESTSGILWRMDLTSHKFTFMAPQIEDVTGYPVDSWTDLELWAERLHPEDRDTAINFCAESTARGEAHDFTYRMITADGDMIWIRDVVSVLMKDGKPAELVGFLFDITEERQLASQMKKNEQYLQSILDNSTTVIYMKDLDGRYVLINQLYEKLFHISLEDIVGQTDEKIFPKDVAHTCRANDLAVIEANQAMEFEEFILHDDDMHTYISMKFPVYGEDGEIVGVCGISTDITQRKQTEVELAKLSHAIEQMDDGILITDADSIIEYVNPAFCNITGYSSEEVVGKTPSILKSTAQDPAFYQELWEVISSGKPWHGTLIDCRKDGSFYPAQTTIAPVFSKTGEITHYVSMQRDMTEYNQLEERFHQAQKMEAIGTLVGGIAHDFNNMLSGMLGNLYLAKGKIQHVPEAIRKLEGVEKLGYQAANMISQLLTFARKGQMEMVPFNFTAFMKESIKMAGVSIPENIKLIESITSFDMVMMGDASLLQQVFLNLLNNAHDAVKEQKNPEIHVKLEHIEPDDAFIIKHQRKEYFAHLSVSDNGYGIKRKHLSKIFEPFFTTKEEGKGTGLGLAMSYGAIQTHKGILEVESEINIGTTFHIYLPLCKTKEHLQAQEKINIHKGKGEIILLVDDEEYMRNTLSDVLHELGYSVLTASDGEQALHLFVKHKDEIDLVISDVVMPVLGGVSLAKRIRDMGDQTPFIFMTGYDKEQVTSRIDSIEDCLLMNKPVNPEKLSGDLRRILDS